MSPIFHVSRRDAKLSIRLNSRGYHVFVCSQPTARNRFEDMNQTPNQYSDSRKQEKRFAFSRVEPCDTCTGSQAVTSTHRGSKAK